jgi:hypothetical protein
LNETRGISSSRACSKKGARAELGWVSPVCAHVIEQG